ncbi:hypothetical protein K492DRAFT_183489 [Lichtheimia hyalospora FSU 10163]|nr:hypothetical protein K492DRAFT_183489 [Lichtheimia hyalospora FSU 10163]
MFMRSNYYGSKSYPLNKDCVVDDTGVLEKYGFETVNSSLLFRPEPQNQVEPNFVKAHFVKALENFVQDAQRIMLRRTRNLICADPKPVHDQEPVQDPRAAFLAYHKKLLTQCEFLLKGDRFARQRYIATGGFLQSEAIGEFIHHVFCKSGLVTLEKDQLVPRPLIALTYVMVRESCFLKEKGFSPSNLDASWSQHVGDLGAYKRMCKRNSPSHHLYRDILQGCSNEITYWDKIQQVQTEIVHRPPGEFKGIGSYVLEAKESLWLLNYPQFKEFS